MKLKSILRSAIIAILLTTITTATVTATSTLKVTSLSGETYNFTEQQLQEMPQTTIFAVLYCYGTLLTSGAWSGVQLNYLLTQANVTSEVHSIQFIASDDYTITIPFELAMLPNTIIAYQKDGEQLDGLRLVLPSYNGAAWINQITTINISSMETQPPPTDSEVWISSNPVENRGDNIQPSSTPSPTPKPTPKPTPNNTPLNPTAPLTNITKLNQNLQQQTISNQSKGLDLGTIAVIATVFTLGLLIAIILAYKKRARIKTNMHTITK